MIGEELSQGVPSEAGGKSDSYPRNNPQTMRLATPTAPAAMAMKRFSQESSAPLYKSPTCLRAVSTSIL